MATPSVANNCQFRGICPVVIFLKICQQASSTLSPILPNCVPANFGRKFHPSFSLATQGEKWKSTCRLFFAWQVFGLWYNFYILKLKHKRKRLCLWYKHGENRGACNDLKSLQGARWAPLERAPSRCPINRYDAKRIWSHPTPCHHIRGIHRDFKQFIKHVVTVVTAVTSFTWSLQFIPHVRGGAGGGCGEKNKVNFVRRV